MIDTTDLTNGDLNFVFDLVQGNKIKIVKRYNTLTEEEIGIIRKRKDRYLFFENGDLHGLYKWRHYIAEIHLDNIQLENKVNRLLKFKNLYKK